MKKKVLRITALVGALLAGMVTLAPPAHADDYLGTKYINYPGHGNAQIRLRLHSWRVLAGIDQAEGSFAKTVDGEIQSITLTNLELFELDAPNGSLHKLAGTGGLPGCYGANTPNCPNGEDTSNVGCMHPQAAPEDINKGDQVWVTARMRIHWEDGSDSNILEYSSNVVTFTLSSQCGD